MTVKVFSMSQLAISVVPIKELDHTMINKSIKKGNNTFFVFMVQLIVIYQDFTTILLYY